MSEWRFPRLAEEAFRSCRRPWVGVMGNVWRRDYRVAV